MTPMLRILSRSVPMRSSPPAERAMRARATPFTKRNSSTIVHGEDSENMRADDDPDDQIAGDLGQGDGPGSPPGQIGREKEEPEE